MTPWTDSPTLKIDHDLPPAQRIAAIPEHAVTATLPLLHAILREFPAPAKAIADLARIRTANRFHAEAVAIGKRINLGWRPIILANICYDLALAALGCSTVALPTPTGPVLARNMDWWPQDLLARATYRIEHQRKDCEGETGGIAYISAGFVGSIGIVTACAPNRFALALNAAICDHGHDPLGYPVLLFLRRVMDTAKDYDEASRMIREARLAAPCIVTVVGTTNDQRIIIEKSPNRMETRMAAAANQPLVATNNFHVVQANLVATARKGADEIAVSCSTRYDRLAELAAATDTTQSGLGDTLLHHLSDPDIIQSITAQHTVAQPSTGLMRVAVPSRLLDTEDAASTNA